MGMTLYCKIIKADDMEWNGKHGNALEGDVTIFTDLEKIVRPYKNGTGRMREEIILHHNDGTTGRVDGHLVGSGEE